MTTQLTIGGGSGARLSPCGRYRYELTRQVAVEGGVCNLIMLNPSTADAHIDDPTIRRCVWFARLWGYGSLVVTNLFALRATDPKALRAVSESEAVGPDNDGSIFEVAMRANVIVAAWGANGELHGRGARVREMIEGNGYELHYLRRTASGQPMHPLYLPRETHPTLWKR